MIRVENEASAKVARKLGMTVERQVEYYGYRTRVWVSPAPEPLR
jgi:RimJ/RimL family protein N-acetyltransferase